MSDLKKEPQRAHSDKAVATQAPAKAAAPATPLTCRNCASKAVYETDGVATEKVAYCRKHTPRNVSKDMLERYKAR